MGFILVIALGIVAELVVSTGDLSHTKLPVITKKSLLPKSDVSEDRHRPEPKVQSL
jgi:hypothetical protein